MSIADAREKAAECDGIAAAALPQPTGQHPPRNQTSWAGNQTGASSVEGEAERRNRELLEAYEFAELVKEAGLATGRRRRELEEMAAARVPSPHRVGPPLTIAPWLNER